MNLPSLDDLGCLSSSLLSLPLLEVLVLDLSGCGNVSLESRLELHQAIKSLKGVDTWVNIDGLPPRRWFPSSPGPLFNRWARGWARRRRPGHPGLGFDPTKFGRSATSSDESADEAPPEIAHGVYPLDENQPFPCSHSACNSFHSSDAGYCDEHRWFGLGKRMCLAANASRQKMELGVLILTQAAAEVESRYLLLLILLSLFPIASYSISESTGAPGTLIFVLLASGAIISIVYTTTRLNRMQELSKKLEIESEALYAKHLQDDLSRVFGHQGGDEIVQPHITTLKDHYLEARKQFNNFDREVCLPLQDFLEEQPGSISQHDLRPVLLTLQQAQEAAVREGNPDRILDLLHCNVMFDDWQKMVRAWSFLKTRLGGADEGVAVVRERDAFAFAQGVRCAEMVVKIDNYFTTIRFLEASLSQLQSQIDDVHRLAESLGLVAGRLHFDPLRISRRSTYQSWLIVAAVGTLRAISLLAALYLAVQYFVRYSPPRIRSNLPFFLQDALALEQSQLEFEASGSGGPVKDEAFIVFSLPYLALIIVLLSDLRRCRSAEVKLKRLKPTQVLYEEYFGIEGKFYGFRVAMLQLFTVLLQALGKLEFLGGIVSFSVRAAPDLQNSFRGCFWFFVAFLCLNSIYPSILFGFPFVKWVRVGAAVMDAVLDIAYTSTYLMVNLLAMYQSQLSNAVSGNFGDEEIAESVNFPADLGSAFAFPSDFMGFFAVYYSIAHVCTVCRALERNDRTNHRRMVQTPLLQPTGSLKSSRPKCVLLCKVLSPGYSLKGVLARVSYKRVRRECFKLFY